MADASAAMMTQRTNDSKDRMDMAGPRVVLMNPATVSEKRQSKKNEAGGRARAIVAYYPAGCTGQYVSEAVLFLLRFGFRGGLFHGLLGGRFFGGFFRGAALGHRRPPD